MAASSRRPVAAAHAVAPSLRVTARTTTGFDEGPLRVAGSRMSIPAPRRPVVVGRDELRLAVRAHLSAGTSTLLTGPAGIGKSTVLELLADDLASETGDHPRHRVVRAACAEVENGLPYLTLVDLFGPVLPGYAQHLPGHLRAALDAALLRSAVARTPHDQLAVHLAVLELLRAMAADEPVLLVIDDIQWMDAPSAAVLAFVARRIGDLPIRVLAAERVAEPGSEPTRTALCPTDHVRVPLAPLSRDEIADLLRARFGARLSRAAIERIHLAAVGNPLFAVELARAFVERGESATTAAPLPVPQRLRTLLAARLAALPPSAGMALVLVSAAARPSQAMIAAAGLDLTAALGAGVLSVERDGALRFSHPLLREMVYADAAEPARIEAHARLAELVDDPVERARHLAVARTEPDESLAMTLMDAADLARRRGAPTVAMDLARLAADRTGDAERAAERYLSAARYAYASGIAEDTGELATRALRASSAATRIHARLLLIDLAGQDQSGVAPLLEAAQQDTSEAPGLAGRVRLSRAIKNCYDGDIEGGIAELKRAEEAAEQAGDLECLVEVLARRANLDAANNVAQSDRLMERAAALSHGLPLSEEVVIARQLSTIAQLKRGEVGEAVRSIESLRVAVEQTGAIGSLAVVLYTAASAYSRAGRCADALAAGRACARLFADISGGTAGPGLLVGALVELVGGTIEQARAYADQAVAASTAAGDEDWLRGAYAVQGQIRLLAGDPVSAVVPMRRAYDLELRRGPADPASFLWHGDFAEALAGAGARDEAMELLADVGAQAHRLSRYVVELGLTRAHAVVIAANGDIRAGASLLGEAVQGNHDHPYPFEVARAYHTLGNLERRAHRRGAARDALAEAVSRYAMLGATPWHAVAQTELAKLDGGRGAGLSETERRIVALLRGGATNREIARATFLSVKAVEANLTRLYRRYGVRGRDQLVRAVGDSSAA